MTDDELRSLFQDVGQKIDGVRQELGQEIAETRRHSQVLFEAAKHETQLVGESVILLTEEVRRNAEKIDADIREMREMILFSHGELDRRLKIVEKK
jgi:uncharacterized protein with HEPN domain